MCLTIRPLLLVLGAHCFTFLQARHFCKAQNGSYHQKFILGYLFRAALRLRGSKCARRSAPVKGPTFQG